MGNEMSAALKISDRAVALRRTFVAAFAALREHAKSRPDEVADLYDAIAAQVRSASPQSFLVDARPMIVAGDAAAEVRRNLADGQAYALTAHAAEETITLLASDDESGVCLGLSVQAARTLRDDIERVMAAVAGARR